ncbi:cytochrome P450 6a2-like [Euwallacea fornicatus]|uniref:cytochrome P450 6a2-like n=1 Tax=Euwallacea fornicatus TaxID=995702 RepID=UPI00338F5B2C
MILILLGIVCMLAYAYFKNAYRYWTTLGVPQLNPNFPFGDFKDVIFRKQNMGDKIKDVYDQERLKGHNFVGLYFFSRKAFLPLEPLLIKNILGRDFQHFYDRGIYYDEENDPLSAHLFSISGPKWKNLRAKLTPAYSPVKLKGMFDTILNCGKQMSDVIGEISDAEGEVEIKEIMARYSTDVIGCCAFGLDCNTMRDPEADFRKMGCRAFTQTIGDVIKMIIIRSFPSIAKLLRIGVFSSDVTQFFRRVVSETIAYRESNNIQRSDLMQLIIELKRNGKIAEGDEKIKTSFQPGLALTVDEAAAQAFIFFLAGFETTSTTTSLALFEIASNPLIQQNVRNEVLHTVAKYDNQITYDGLMEMKYLDTVINETLRKYPPAPVFLRKCTKRYPIPNTQAFIEEGQSVLIPCLGLHRDPKYFPNPELFDPDRFSEENQRKLTEGTYIPFGSGPRNCIGMRFAMIQSKIALSLFLLNYECRLSKRTKLPLKMETKGIILTPIGGLWIEFKRRGDK